MQNGRLTYSRENTNGARNGEEQRKYLHSYKYMLGNRIGCFVDDVDDGTSVDDYKHICEHVDD